MRAYRCFFSIIPFWFRNQFRVAVRRDLCSLPVRKSNRNQFVRRCGPILQFPENLKMESMTMAYRREWTEQYIMGKNSRRMTWRNERTKEVQERVTWTSRGVDSYTLSAPIWRHGRVSYQPKGLTPVKPTPVGGKLKRRRKHTQLASRWRWRWTTYAFVIHGIAGVCTYTLVLHDAWFHHFEYRSNVIG